MCIHGKREEAKIFEDHAVATYKDSPLIGHVPFQWNYFLFLNLLGREITKYLLKSTEEENW